MSQQQTKSTGYSEMKQTTQDRIRIANYGNEQEFDSFGQLRKHCKREHRNTKETRLQADAIHDRNTSTTASTNSSVMKHRRIPEALTL